MWIELWVPKFISDAFLEALRDEVLQAFGFIVNLVDGIVENLIEKGLNQSMVADNLQRASLASAGETNPIMSLVIDKWWRGSCELLDHACHGRRCDSKSLS